MIEAISRLLIDQGFTWTIDGQTILPTPSKVQDILDQAKEVLTKEKTGAEYYRGGIVVRKETSATYDVYVHIGEF